MNKNNHKNTTQNKTLQNQYPDEIQNLNTINQHIKTSIKETLQSVTRLDKEYKDTKIYMANYKGEIDPREMFQEQMLLNQIDQTGAFTSKKLQKLIKQQNTPYFARIDFAQENQTTPTKYYIGVYTYTQNQQILIHDWRSPIASLFYDYDKGEASYQAPIGPIKGQLTLKRQIKIKNSKIDYILESNTNIQDDVLQKELANTSDEKMKSIISTLQKEQNQIIRNQQKQTTIIQGVAGSGKTSIALHKIAFLLYRHKNTLTSDNIEILSPNKVFADYISFVLPELGENTIHEQSFDQIAQNQLENNLTFIPEEEYTPQNPQQYSKRASYKSSTNLLQQIKQYLNHLNTTIFQATDYNHQDLTINSHWIKNRYNAYHNYPITTKIQKISQDIIEEYSTKHYNQEKPKLSIVQKTLKTMLKHKTSLSIYKEFYKWLNKPDHLQMPNKTTLEPSDIYPYLYIKNYFEGLKTNKTIKHLVIDEMQDYTPIQYTIINIIYPCEKTILGDFGQQLNPHHTHTLQDLKQIYHNSNYVELNKSYRSTYEIITLATKIKPNQKLQPILRTGQTPKLHPCQNHKSQLKEITKIIEKFNKTNQTTLAILVKTPQDAQTLYNQLSPTHKTNLITTNSHKFQTGITISTIKMSKGLEFDQVIIPNVDNKTYHQTSDQNLLYIAITRAMHNLNLTYIKTPSPFLPPSN